MADRAPPEGSSPPSNPSIVTTDAIDRAVSNAMEVLNARLEGQEKAVVVFQDNLTRVPTTVDRSILGLREVIEARLSGMDKDMASIHVYIGERKEAIKEQIGHLHELMVSKVEELASVTNERFAGVTSQFEERDTRTDQRAGDTKLAVDAAFAAAKEATSKIEMGFTKSIDGQQELLKTTTKSTDDKIADLKDRLTAIESRTQGVGVANSNARDDRLEGRGQLFGVVGIVIGVSSLIVALLLHFVK